MGFLIFPMVISPKVNAIERLEFELTSYDVTSFDVGHYATETPSVIFFISFLSYEQQCLLS